MSNNWDFIPLISLDIKADPEKRQARVDTCNECEKLTALKTCQICGCIMPFKTWLNNSNCPLGKW